MNVVMGQTLVTRIQNALTLQEVMFVDAFRDFLVMVIHVKVFFFSTFPFGRTQSVRTKR